MAKADPIFALIKRHAAAERSFGKAVEKFGKLEAKLDGEDRRKHGLIGTTMPSHMRTTTDDPKVFVNLEWIVANNADIERLLSQAYGNPLPLGPKAMRRFRAGKSEARRELRGLLAKAIRQRKADQKRSGWAAVRREWEDAETVAATCLRKLCTTIPTTTAGLAALLAHLQTTMEDGAGIGDFADGRTDAFAKTLAKAAARLAAKAGAR